MITIRKIRSLRPRVQLRKAADAFHNAAALSPGTEYLEACLDIILSSGEIDDKTKDDVRSYYGKGEPDSYKDIYFAVMLALGESFADWDASLDDGSTDWSRRRTAEHYLYLDRIRSPYNVGSIFRSAESFGVKRIFLSPGTASPLHPRALRTSRNTVEGVEWEYRDISQMDPALPVFALEVGGTDIDDFSFPERGLCVIGSEESGVGREALEAASRSLGKVEIAMYGAKGSINVSSAAAILLHAWKL